MMNLRTAILLNMARSAYNLVQDGAENAASFDTGIEDALLLEQCLINAFNDDPLNPELTKWRDAGLRCREYREALRRANSGNEDTSPDAYQALVDIFDAASADGDAAIQEALQG